MKSIAGVAATDQLFKQLQSKRREAAYRGEPGASMLITFSPEGYREVMNSLNELNFSVHDHFERKLFGCRYTVDALQNDPYIIWTADSAEK